VHKGNFREGLLMGWGLTPKGDADLIMASSALALGILTSSMFTAIITMSLVTTIVAPVIFKRLIARYGSDKNLMK
jgi:Kef-type K+ transport system membrane component KefB